MSNFGVLGDFLSKIEKASDGLPYIPLESTVGKVKTKTRGETFYTGPEAFIDRALQEGDISFKEFSKFVDEFHKLRSIGDIEII